MPVKKKTVKDPDAKKLRVKAAHQGDFDHKAELDNFINNINSKFQTGGALSRGDAFSNPWKLRRPTGITSIDVAIAGGFPAGGVSQIIGPEGVGKDYLINCIIAELQSNYSDDSSVLLCHTEFQYDKEFGKKCGVRVALSDEEIINWQKAIGREFTPEEMNWAKDQIGTLHQAQYAQAERLLEVAARAIESNLYQIVVVNSVGALLTAAEDEAKGGIEDKHRGGAAMVITQFMHRVHAALLSKDNWNRNNMTTVIIINQYRDNVGQVYGDPLKQAGGWALKHGKMIDLYLRTGSKHSDQITATSKVAIGKEVRWEVTKGKAGCHEGGSGQYDFYFGERDKLFGADLLTDILVAAVDAGVVVQAGAWFYYKDQSIGQGKTNAVAYIASNPDFYYQLRTEIFKAKKIDFFTRE